MSDQLSYDDGGPADEVNPNLWEWLSAAAVTAKGRPAVISVRQNTSHLESLVPSSQRQSAHFTWTYEDLLEAVDKVARYCVAQGISHGDCLAIYFHNCADWALFYWLSVRLGTTLVSMDPASLDAATLTAHFLSSLNPKAVIVQNDDMAKKFDSHRDMIPTQQAVKVISAPAENSQAIPSWTFLAEIEFPDESALISPPEDINHINRIAYTSGSTNLPKGCLLTNRVIESEIAQISKLDLGWSTSTRYMLIAPPFTAIGYLGSLSTWRHGGCVIFQKNDWKDRKAIVEDIISTEATHIWSLPSKVSLLASTVKENPGLVTKSLEYAMGSGELNHSSTREHIKEALGAKHMASYWGMTEGCAAIALSATTPMDKWPVATPAKIATIGKALAGSAVKVANASNQPIPRGDYGELQVSSPAFIDGYLDFRGADSFYIDEKDRNWFKTGDQALMDSEGFIYIFGRLGDQFQTKDAAVVPSIVDEIVKKAFGVESWVFTVGIPDPLNDGKKMIITVLPKPQQEIDSKLPHVSKTLQAKLGPASVPEAFVALDCIASNGAWPLTSTGKVQRSAVEDLVSEKLRRGAITFQRRH